MGITMEKVNSISREEFTGYFANIIEHCRDCAEFAEGKRPFSSPKHLHSTFCDFVDNSSDAKRIEILRSHPDLAGRIAKLGLLTPESSKEQKAAGLDTLTLEEANVLNDLNQRYQKKFGFPFVICARENKKNAIMTGMAERINNSAQNELHTGIEEVKKIAYYRITDLLEQNREEAGVTKN